MTTHKTLEDLYNILCEAIDTQDTTAAAAHAAYTVERAYNLRRAAKVKEIAEYIVDYMNEPQFAAAIAERIHNLSRRMIMSMNFTLTKIKYFASMSHETYCFQAVLCLDGKPVAEIENSGTGGADFQYPIGGADLVKLNELITATYPPLRFMEEEYPATMESICNRMLSEWIAIRSMKRANARRRR